MLHEVLARTYLGYSKELSQRIAFLTLEAFSLKARLAEPLETLPVVGALRHTRVA